MCCQTRFSIQGELTPTSHEHQDQCRLPDSNIVPNHEKRHLEASRIKFSPFKLNRDRLSEFSFISPKTWMVGVWCEKNGFWLKISLTPDCRITCQGHKVNVSSCLVCPIPIYSFATWMQYAFKFLHNGCDLRGHVRIFNKPKGFFMMVMYLRVPQILRVWTTFEFSFRGHVCFSRPQSLLGGINLYNCFPRGGDLFGKTPSHKGWGISIAEANFGF